MKTGKETGLSQICNPINRYRVEELWNFNAMDKRQFTVTTNIYPPNGYDIEQLLQLFSKRYPVFGDTAMNNEVSVLMRFCFEGSFITKHIYNNIS